MTYDIFDFDDDSGSKCTFRWLKDHTQSICTDPVFQFIGMVFTFSIKQVIPLGLEKYPDWYYGEFEDSSRDERKNLFELSKE